MKIEKVQIKNFRAFKDETVYLSGYNSFVGANGTGKSSVLAALNLFFGEPCSPGVGSFQVEKDDFFQKNVSNPIEISVTFTDLSPDETDALKAYVRHKKLIITTKASFSEVDGKGSATQFGSRMAMLDFANFFKSADEGVNAYSGSNRTLIPVTTERRFR